jgi:shikimate kinase
MHLSLIGMSGSGKSLWSAKLSAVGFRHFCCDDLISEALSSELTRPDGSLMELGEWMGLPCESGYEAREATYLTREIEVLRRIVEYLESGSGAIEKDIVVDTTGSVIYTGENLLKRLRRSTTVIHLATPPEIQERMFESYVADKRPILWRGLFAKAPGETTKAALARCYRELLSARERLYEQHADVTIDRQRFSQRGFGIDDFLQMARSGKAFKETL